MSEREITGDKWKECVDCKELNVRETICGIRDEFDDFRNKGKVAYNLFYELKEAKRANAKLMEEVETLTTRMAEMYTREEVEEIVTMALNRIYNEELGAWGCGVTKYCSKLKYGCGYECNFKLRRKDGEKCESLSSQREGMYTREQVIAELVGIADIPGSYFVCQSCEWWCNEKCTWETECDTEYKGFKLRLKTQGP